VLLERKQQIAQELHGCFERAKVVILTDYKGLNVGAMTELRRRLKQAGIEYRVVKNSLLERASADTPAAAIKDAFKGPSAIALSYDDPVAPAKVLSQFAKENDKLKIRLGVLSGKVIGEADIKSLADLPPREVLLAQLLGVLNAVPTSFVRALSAVPGGMVNVLNAIKEQREQKEAA
jgi:large subunit ribosomal protein L10